MVILYLFILSFATATNLSSLARDQGEVVFMYPKDVYSERDLDECPAKTACSVVYRRFWQPPLVERLCRCPAPSECSWQWKNINDNRTISLDNRSQLKFCRSLQNLPVCKNRQHAMTVSTTVLQHTTRRPRTRKVGKTKADGKSKMGLRGPDHRAVTAHCNCQGLPFWANGKNKNEYLCSELSKCDKGQKCGYVRKDLHSTYYFCSCPEGNQCVPNNKITTFKNLFLYSGPVYTAICSPVN